MTMFQAAAHQHGVGGRLDAVGADLRDQQRRRPEKTAAPQSKVEGFPAREQRRCFSQEVHHVDGGRGGCFAQH